MRSNEVWILIGGFGDRTHESNAYWVVRKYKRRPGYSVRYVARYFSGYTVSDRVKKFKTFPEVVEYITERASARVSPWWVLDALETSENREFWREEIEWLEAELRKLEGREVHESHQATLEEVIS